MKVTIERSVLLKALGHVHSVVERRNTVPILSNILLRAKDSTLFLTATDLEIEVSESVPADIADEGVTTVSALTLYEIVRRLPDGAQVLFRMLPEESSLQVSSGRSQFVLSVLPDEDFPDLSSGAPGAGFSVPAEDLKLLLQKTRFAMSQEETRRYLNGVYLHTVTDSGKPYLCAVSTDGHRLARIRTALPDGADGMPGVIVPRKAILELVRLLEDTQDPVAIGVSPSQIRFSFGAGYLISKLVDGSFPDYASVIPEGNRNVLHVDTRSFAQSVDRVSIVSVDRIRSVKLSVESGCLRLAVNNPEAGSALEEVSADYDGDVLEIGFNARYLLEIIQQIDGGKTTLQLADPSSPTVIVDEEDTRALFVLMPLRV